MKQAINTNEITGPTATPKGVVVPDVDGNITLVSRYIDLVKASFDIDTGDFRGVLEFESPRGRKSISVKREVYVLQENLKTLVNKGINITRQNMASVSEALQNREMELEMGEEVEIVHSSLGFGVFEDRRIFKLYDCIGIKSRYVGSRDVTPHGSYDLYMEMLEQYVLPFPPLTFILTASLATVILGYLGDKMDFENYIIHLTGQSSSGKTTAAMLAISPFSCPDKKKNTLMATYNSTDTGLLALLRGLNGVPFAFDEISTSKLKSFTKMIYSISNGADKIRCNSDAEIKETGTWRTIVFSTGEHSILERSNQNVGLRVRAFEFSIDAWTQNAKASKDIKKCVMENHGQLGMLFAKAVMETDSEKLLSMMEKKNEIMLKRLAKRGYVDDFTDRRCIFYSLLLTTKEIMKKKLGLKVDSVQLIKFLINAEAKALEERNLSKKFILFLQDYIFENDMHFVRDSRNRSLSNGIWGWLKGKDNERTVTFLPSTFKKAVEAYGHESYTVMAKQLHRDGFLITEDGKRQIGRKIIDGNRTNVYEIRLFIPEET